MAFVPGLLADVFLALGLLMDFVPLKLPSEIVPKLRATVFFAGAGVGAAFAFGLGLVPLPKRDWVKLRLMGAGGGAGGSSGAGLGAGPKNEKAGLATFGAGAGAGAVRRRGQVKQQSVYAGFGGEDNKDVDV